MQNVQSRVIVQSVELRQQRLGGNTTEDTQSQINIKQLLWGGKDIKEEPLTYGLLLLHHSRMRSWEERRDANSCRTPSLAGAFDRWKNSVSTSGSLCLCLSGLLSGAGWHLLQVEDAEQSSGRAQAATLSPTQQQQQASQRPELLPQ